MGKSGQVLARVNKSDPRRAKDGQKRLQVAKSGPKWSKDGQSGPKGTFYKKWVKKLIKMDKSGQSIKTC